MKLSTKDRIMYSAFNLFLEKGFASVSMSEIKKMSNVSTGTFYHYFPSKDELIVKVMEKYIFDFFDESLENISKFEGTSKDQLYYLIIQVIGFDAKTGKSTEFYEEFNITDYRKLHLLYLEGIQKYELMSKKYHDFNLKLLKHIEKIVLEGQQNNEIKDYDYEKLAKFIQSTINGTFLMWIAVPELDLINLLKSNMNHMWCYIEK